MSNQINALIIDSKDNCAVALRDLQKGDFVLDTTLIEDIPTAHKFSLANISSGTDIIKYGNVIGKATKDIKKGAHIHTHNIKTNLRNNLTYSYTPNLETTKIKSREFLGYKRDDSSVGIRNEIWIINTVGCVNFVSREIAKLAEVCENIDGVYSFDHPFGCSQLGEDHKTTQLILKNMVTHPNAAGVLVVGLGCENNNIDEFKKILGDYDENRVKFLVCQEHNDEIKEGLSLVSELSKYAQKFSRQKVSLSNLTIGLKCGGSDGFSGITANPLVGRISDTIISYGGSSILTEVPEMFGAEQLLMDRCENVTLYNETVDLINNFKDYFTNHGQEIYENPSPGNKKGGISTLEDKSLGCTQKSGTSNVIDVLNYGDTVKRKGLNLLNGPGNDIVAITNLMAAHAHIVLFTTGRGTPVGSCIPTLKISSNTNLSEHKSNWIDFNAGVILEGKTIDETKDALFELIVEVAEGKKTKNEINNFREISIFKDGVIL